MELTAPQLLFAASSAVSAVSSLAQGRASSQAAQYNSELATREATQVRASAKIKEADHRANLRRFLATQRADAGASGLLVSEGSAGLLAADAAAQGERDALMIRYSGSVAAAQSLSEAAAQRFQGRAARAQGILGAGAGLLKAGGGFYPGPSKKKLGG